MKKKVIAVLLVSTMVFAMTGCAGSGKSSAASEAASAAAEAVSEAKEEAEAAVSSAVSEAEEEAEAAVSSAVSEAEEAVSEAAEAVSEAKEEAEAAVSSAVSEAEEAASEAAEAVSKAKEEAEAAASSAVSEAEEAVSEAAEAVSEAKEEAEAAVSSAVSEAEEAASEAEEAVSEAKEEAEAAVSSAVSEAEEAASEAEESASEAASEAEKATSEEEAVEGPSLDGDVMSFEEYAAAEVDTPVLVETYVQAKQSWYEGGASIYTQNEEGAYFLYSMPCTEEEYEQLVPGTKIKVAGYKAEFSGEIEIIDSVFEIEDGTFTAEAEDVTDLLGKDELENSMNRMVSFKGMTIEPSVADGSEEEEAFLYSWNGSGQEGDDLYFKASVNGETYTFTVETNLCDSSSDVYKAVQDLKIGDVVDMEGFLYWYEGPNPHITAVTAAK